MNTVWNDSHEPGAPCWKTKLAVLTAPDGSVALPKFRKNW